MASPSDHVKSGFIHHLKSSSSPEKPSHGLFESHLKKFSAHNMTEKDCIDACINACHFGPVGSEPDFFYRSAAYEAQFLIAAEKIMPHEHSTVAAAFKSSFWDTAMETWAVPLAKEFVPIADIQDKDEQVQRLQSWGAQFFLGINFFNTKTGAGFEKTQESVLKKTKNALEKELFDLKKHRLESLVKELNKIPVDKHIPWDMIPKLPNLQNVTHADTHQTFEEMKIILDKIVAAGFAKDPDAFKKSIRAQFE